MKITEIDVRLVDANFRNLIITQIHTNKGITGASEVVTKRFDDATMHAVRNLTENIAWLVKTHDSQHYTLNVCIEITNGRLVPLQLLL